MYKANMEEFMESLYEIGSVKFDKFVLSSGLVTPVYFDLRILISHPKLLNQASLLMKEYIDKHKIDYDIICGVPYGALGLATALSIQTDKPAVFKRHEAKNYGLGKLVEGVYEKGDRCLLVEDVVVYGSGSIECIKNLEQVGINVTDTITLLDREQGGADNIRSHGAKFHGVIKASDLLEHLFKKGKISQQTKEDTITFLLSNTYEKSSKQQQQQQQQQQEVEVRVVNGGSH